METTIDRIMSLIPEKHGSEKQFCDAIGIKQQKLSDWKAGRSGSLELYVYKIAYVYDVSAKWLLTGEGPKKISPVSTLTEDENMILNLYHQLTERDKGRICERMEFLIESYASTQDTDSAAVS